MGEATDEPASRGRYGLVAGPSVFLAMVLLPPPAGLQEPAWAVAAVAVLMIIWWMTEALPLAATALVPVVLLPIMGVQASEEVARAYAHPLVFLFLGGFLVAKALEGWGLHRRLALTIVRYGPSGPAGLIGSLMVATAFLSMWISNTATAMVMLPIALSIAATARSTEGPGEPSDFSAALMLGVAFSATIGGMATLIGTPPNALLAAYMASVHGIEIGFAAWMALGLPIVAVLLPLTWLVLTRIVFQVEAADLPEPRSAGSGEFEAPLEPGARLTAAVALLTGLALVLQPLAASLLPQAPLSDAGIVVAAALILLAVPAPGGAGRRLLDWQQALTIRWDVLVLFGGGLALAAAMQSSGLSQAIGDGVSRLDFLPTAAIVLLAMVVIVYLGELASNTAVAAIFLPVAGSVAAGLGVGPAELVLPIGLAASLGFMLPVATPPNAIVYGTGGVSSRQMLRAGALLDVLTIPIVYAIVLALGAVVVGR
ncbi:MAG: DASS family sodium-coupled anion symporter [Rhizobiales bacterium]|nr:DASS family sodium-coupled anion symporter [Hyphomicrobiales bacterium]